MKKDSRVKAVISLDAVEHNFREMRKNIAEETRMIAVIKADAYGHGAVPVAHLIEDYDYIWGFAAATAEEAIHLREAGITKPILILGIVFDEYFPELVRYEIRPAVCEYEEARKLSDEAVLQKKTVHIHIALDTGMTRIGFADTQENVEEIKKISELPNLEIEGMFTHFARADEYDRSPAMVQLERYLDFSRRVEEAGVEIPLHHCSNSAGIIRMPEANLNIVRAGITIYGIYPSSEVERDIVKLVPVTYVILNDQNRPDSTLFTPHYRAKISIKYIPSFNYHTIHTPILSGFNLQHCHKKKPCYQPDISCPVKIKYFHLFLVYTCVVYKNQLSLTSSLFSKQ